MIWRLTVGVLFILFAVQGFLHAGLATTEIAAPLRPSGGGARG
jgi:hypothetical protein